MLSTSITSLVVTKKDGGKRLVTQFMKLNEVTVRDPWPIPSLKDTVEEIGSSNWLSNVDILKGFNAIGVVSSSVNKLSVSTPFGAFSYKALPFAVLNGPSAYASQVRSCTHSVLRRQIDVKRQQVGIKPLAEKVQKIVDFPQPQNQTGIRAFVNFCGFYRNHINCFTEIVEPLLKLLKKNCNFLWSEDCENAFKHLKSAIVNAATLSFPDQTKPFYLFCDASNIGIGSTLSQKDNSGDFVPGCFYSRKLQTAEVNYPTVETELLCVVNSVAKFRKYLLDRHFTVFTDNAATSYLFSENEPSSRLLRWYLSLQEFDSSIRHIPGKNNVVAAVLSRFPPDELLCELDGESELEKLYDHLLVETSTIYEEPLMKIFYNLKAGVILDDPKELRNLLNKYKIYQEHLYKKLFNNKFVIIPYISERQDTICNVHDGFGHFGVNATWRRLYERFWWPSAYNDVQLYIKTCQLCQLYSSSPPTLPHGHIPINYLFQQYSLDFIGPFPVSNNNNKFILMAVENFSNWPIAESIPTQDSSVVANFLYEKIFCQFGPFTSILTDNGSPFANDIIDKFVAIVQSKHLYTSPYRPQCNGKNEKLNGTIARAIKKLTHNDPLNWDLHLHSVLYAYRTKVHGTTKISPYQLLYGQEPLPCNPNPILELGINLGFERYSKLVDRNSLNEVLQSLKPIRTSSDIAKHPKLLQPGDYIIQKRKKKTRKLDTMFEPEIFKIITTYNNHSYQVADSNNRILQRTLNHNNVRQYFPRVPRNGGGEDVA
ncbi:hypothetical protein [Parasitella parasitica]|uniref:Integrase catalytic domain-containing protein n=1 Tax=Parasitella parasitica TaxID=35722 RepID=A0A0B7NAS3_9FUNG|nr:hypothetical protein [Parasitella parasitica]